MPNNKSFPHTGPHKYERLTVGKKGHEIFKCVLPDCPHYLPYKELAIGRVSLCWGCNGEVEMTKEMVMWKSTPKPYCENCRKERNERRLALMAIGTEEEKGEEYEE